MITRLTMKDFRGIVQGDVKDFAQVNILLGPNNAGKTTILEALYLAATTNKGCSLKFYEHGELESIPVTVAAEQDVLGLHPMVRIWQRHNFPPRWLEAPARWEQGEIHFGFMPKPLEAWALLHSPDIIQKTFAQGQEELIAVLRMKVQENHKPVPTFVSQYLGDQTYDWKNSHVIFMWEPNFTFRRNGTAAWIIEGDIPSAANTLFYDFHTTHEHFTQAFVDRGYNETNQWQRRTAKSFARIFDLPTDPEPYVSFTPYKYAEDRSEVLVEQYGRMVPLDTWGDGSRHVLKVLPPLIMLSDAAEKGEPGLVLWEDPEIFLNPHALHRLMREVLLIIKDKPVQLFITTQNIDIVESLTDLVQEMDCVNILRAFRQKIDQGKLVTSRFNYDNLEAWIGSGIDPRYW